MDSTDNGQPLLPVAGFAQNVIFTSNQQPTTSNPPHLSCHRCGYDLRAHAQSAQCPECGESVAESARLSAVPYRPAWRDSDPRWRRRMLAGAWVLTFLPLMDALQRSGWASSIRVPNILGLPGAAHMLDETQLADTSSMRVYQPILFCIGLALLFSREQGRRHHALDWTRRWGLICSCVTLLLIADYVLFIWALVVMGIGALLQSMPLRYQPRVTRLFVEVGTNYIHYGPQPKGICNVVLIIFSSIAVLLACVPLFEALRRSGPTKVAAVIVTPLGLLALLYLAQAGLYCTGISHENSEDLYRSAIYFHPDILVRDLAGLPGDLYQPRYLLDISFVEIAKWGIVLSIAVWLTIAQVTALRWSKAA